MHIHDMPADINDNKYWFIQKESSEHIILLAFLFYREVRGQGQLQTPSSQTHLKRLV